MTINMSRFLIVLACISLVLAFVCRFVCPLIVRPDTWLAGTAILLLFSCAFSLQEIATRLAACPPSADKPEA